MIDLNFSREFFAAMLVTEVEKVGFAVLIRTFPMQWNCSTPLS